MVWTFLISISLLPVLNPFMVEAFLLDSSRPWVSSFIKLSIVNIPSGAYTDTAEVKFVYITAVTGVGSSPALATCETSQVLLAGVSGDFSRGSPVSAPPTDWPVSYELK